MTAAGRGARIQFGGSPWSRQALQREPERAFELAHRAQDAGCNVSITGKTEKGPWVVNLTRGARRIRVAGDGLHDLIAFGLDRWAAGASDDGIRWIAGGDKLGHGHAGRGPWTLCKRLGVPETGAHPELRRCQACWLALDKRVGQGAA